MQRKPRKIVVTGARGFIGKNLCTFLEERGYNNIVRVGRETSRDVLNAALDDADFVYHLAGVNRPQREDEFSEVNADFTRYIVEYLSQLERPVPILLSSSTQATQENPYGRSKRSAEVMVEKYSKFVNAECAIYRLPNVFGKWCKPNYNSVVATFSYNIANDIDIDIHDENALVDLVYIDDVCEAFIRHLDEIVENEVFEIQPVYRTTVGAVAELLYKFKASRSTLTTEKVGTGFIRALYSTYLSYIPPQKFSYPIPSHVDERGGFSEVLKTADSGQFSFFTAHPGVTRGGHYHHSKNEKFLVLTGSALFKFENVITGERFELRSDGGSPCVVESIPGWSHDISNIGSGEMIVMLWANEIFDPEAADTFPKPL